MNECETAGFVATSVEMHRFFLSRGKLDDARAAQLCVHAAHNPASVDSEGEGSIAVSWEGLSLDFLSRFEHENAKKLRYLSTDAVVNRSIKPATRAKIMFDPKQEEGVCGMPLIETVHTSFRSAKPTFFVSHAWRQTFTIPVGDTKEAEREASRRGGLVQALLNSVDKDKWEDTTMWLDIFNVNQHLKSPGSDSLMAFVFDPLRNAIAQCDHVKLFLENWDDPAPLTRVWCLDELRHAILLGKRVEICMTPQTMKTFQAIAAKNDKKTVEEIDRFVKRIDVSFASATFPEDRVRVLETVEATIGSDALNKFCQEIVRSALIEAGGLLHFDSGGQAQRKLALEGIVAKLLENGTDKQRKVPARIKLLRAAGVMQQRIFERFEEGQPSDRCEVPAAKKILRKALVLAR